MTRHNQNTVQKRPLVGASFVVPRAALLALILALVLPGDAYAYSWTTGTFNAEATQRMRDLINGEHVRACGTPLATSRQLRDVARWKAADMGLRNTISHTTVDGLRIWNLYDNAGIEWTYGAGEILAVNTFPLDETVRAAFDGWMDSDGHRAAIQNCDYDRFGVGVFRTKDKKWYVAEFTNVVR